MYKCKSVVVAVTVQDMEGMQGKVEAGRLRSIGTVRQKAGSHKDMVSVLVPRGLMKEHANNIIYGRQCAQIYFILTSSCASCLVLGTVMRFAGSAVLPFCRKS
jgi:hypothetical protein